MIAKRVTPILNVSDLEESFAWFEKLGWAKRWAYGAPANFGAVGSGDFEIFLCQRCQGMRSKRPLSAMSPFDSSEKPDSGGWMSIFIDDVDAVHRLCVAQGIEITMPPTDMEWGVREMHVRHPDGHVLRIGTGMEEEN